MRKLAVITSVILSFGGAGKVGAIEYKEGARQRKNSVVLENHRPVDIRVADGNWGPAKPEDIELLLNVIAAEMLEYFPGRQLDPIIVYSAKDGPVVLYQRGPQNAYQILLAAKGENWAEYVYEFSHELFHILSRYEFHAPPHRVRHQWFEEMLCETVSLHMLKRFSAIWEQSPPKAEWKAYAGELKKFTQRALTERHRQLPEKLTFAEWFRKNEKHLVDKPYLRKKNELVASVFLPVLQELPDWRAVSYLNVDHQESDADFRSHLARWYRKTPPSQREFVERAMGLFQMAALPDGRPALASDKLMTPHRDAY